MSREQRADRETTSARTFHKGGSHPDDLAAQLCGQVALLMVDYLPRVAQVGDEDFIGFLRALERGFRKTLAGMVK